MTAERSRYLAFMLRFWQVDSDGAPVWRASLENPHTGERRGFASMEALFEFLRASLASSNPHVVQTQDLAVPEPCAGSGDIRQRQ